MIRNASFRRKVYYLAAMIPVLAALAYLGMPATGALGDPKARRGGMVGKLARMRVANDLSQANLGEIDPAGETMKLATLGLKPAAASILWDKANEYKKKELWDAFSATLNQITKLQPNYITVWEHQAHNLSYNISVEFDDYRHRYHWVVKGIEFLFKGKLVNKNEPKIPWNVGWFTGQKIGRADERVQFRRMFRVDTDFQNLHGEHVAIAHQDALGPDNLHPDNWRVSRLWYLESIKLAGDRNARKSDLDLWFDKRRRFAGGFDSEHDKEKGRSQLIFHADPNMSQINYATTIQEEGKVGEVAQVAWELAGRFWREYGHQPIKSSWGPSLLLYSAEENLQKVAQLVEQLDALAPGERTRLYDQRVANLTSEERAALPLSQAELRDTNYQAHQNATQKTKVTNAEVAERALENVRAKARRLVAEIAELELSIDRTKRYRDIVNYDYWKVRCEAEASDVSVRARRHLYEAQQFFDRAELEGARREYEAAWDDWSEVFEAHPSLMEAVTAKELMEPIRRYRSMLDQMGEPFPTDFKLQRLVDINEHKVPSAPTTVTPAPKDPAKPEDTKPEAEKTEPEKSEAARPDDAKPSDAKPEPAKQPDPKSQI